MEFQGTEYKAFLKTHSSWPNNNQQTGQNWIWLYCISARFHPLAQPLKNTSNAPLLPQSPPRPPRVPGQVSRQPVMEDLPHQTLHLLWQVPVATSPPLQSTGRLRKLASLGLHRGRDRGQSLQGGKDHGPNLQEQKDQSLRRRWGQGLHRVRGQGQHFRKGRGQRHQQVWAPQIGSEPAGDLAHPVAPDLSTGNPDSFSLNGVVHQMPLHYHFILTYFNNIHNWSQASQWY